MMELYGYHYYSIIKNINNSILNFLLFYNYIVMIKINNLKVKPLKTEFTEKKIKHAEMFNNAYPNIFISAKKNSGKSTLIYNILKHCATNKTIIRLFSTTYENDNTIRSMLEKFDKYKIKYELFDNLEFEPKNEEEMNYCDILDK
jgi:hypothetical protein